MPEVSAQIEEGEGGGRLEAVIQDCRVYYEIRRCENDAGPAILFLHGWGCDAAVFSRIAGELDGSATLVTLDFPGHGKSGEPPVPWGVPEYAEMVRLLLAQNGVDKVDIISHSFGSRVAVMLAAKHPELVRKMVVTGGAGIKKPVSRRQSRRSGRYQRFRKILNRFGTIPFLRKPAEKWQAKLRNHYGSPDYVKLDEVMRKTFVKVISEDLSPLLGELKAPTLLIWGSEDTETPLWMGRRMEERIPDAGLVIFEGKGHFAFLEEWRRFALITKQFLLEGQC